jgi:AdoMet-dependent heme synthase
MTPLNVLSAQVKAQRDPQGVAEIPLLRLDWLWLYNPGTACNLACRHCLTLSSPTSKVLLPLETDEIRAALEEVQAATAGGFSIGMTGGEVFLLAQSRYQQRLFDQIELCLSYGDVLILTNAILATDEQLSRLKVIAEAASHKLEFRISLDGASAEENDKIRTGLNDSPTYSSIIAGLHRFVKAGFMPTIAYTYDGEGGKEKVSANLERKSKLFKNALSAAGLPDLELWGIPLFDQGEEFKRREQEGVDHVESPGITNHCISHYLKNAFHDFQCSYSRSFCKEPDGQTGWYKCAVLPAEGVEKGSRISTSFEDALKPIELPHTQCITCFRAATQGCAMSCSGE